MHLLTDVEGSTAEAIKPNPTNVRLEKQKIREAHAGDTVSCNHRGLLSSGVRRYLHIPGQASGDLEKELMYAGVHSPQWSEDMPGSDKMTNLEQRCPVPKTSTQHNKLGSTAQNSCPIADDFLHPCCGVQPPFQQRRRSNNTAGELTTQNASRESRVQMGSRVCC